MATVKEKINNSFEVLKDKLNLKNVMQIKKVEKVIITARVGRLRKDKNKMELVEDHLARIAGQKVIKCRAKKSVAQFKVRAGEVIGYKATLRGEQSLHFLEKLVNVALPRVRDFRGISLASVDVMGNLTIGIREHIAFPETTDVESKDIFGLSITVVANTKTHEEGIIFFKHIGVPFQKK